LGNAMLVLQPPAFTLSVHNRNKRWSGQHSSCTSGRSRL